MDTFNTFFSGSYGTFDGNNVSIPFVDNQKMFINTCVFHLLVAQVGSVIYSTKKDTVTVITACYFKSCIGNDQTNDGGAIMINSPTSSLAISKSCAEGCLCFQRWGQFMYYYTSNNFKVQHMTICGITPIDSGQRCAFHFYYGIMQGQYINISNNLAYSEVAFRLRGTNLTKISYSSFVNNNATYGQIFHYTSGDKSELSFCNIIRNYNQLDNNGIFIAYSSEPYIRYCIISQFTKSNLFYSVTSTITVQHCLILGSYSITGTVSTTNISLPSSSYSFTLINKCAFPTKEPTTYSNGSLQKILIAFVVLI